MTHKPSKPSAEVPAQTAKSTTGLATYLRLLKYLKVYWWALLLVILGFTINAGTEVYIAKLMQQVIDSINAGAKEQYKWFPLIIIGLFVVRGVGEFLGNYFSALIARNVVYKLRIEVFNKLLTLPTNFFLHTSSGKTAAKMIYDVEQVTAAGTDSLKVLIRDGLIVIGLLGFLFYSNWRLSLVLLLILPIIAGLINYASSRFRKLSHKVQDSMGELSHITGEVISGFDVVKNFGGQTSEMTRFDAASKQNLKQSIKIVVTESINTPLVQLIMAVGIALLVWIFLRPEFLGDASAGEFISYIVAMGLLNRPVETLTKINAKLQRGIAGADSIFALLDTQGETDTGQQKPKLRGSIVFDKVGLIYDGGTQALSDFSLDINAGETVAFVGRSGAGKTSLINLLDRTFDATSGRILLDGIDIRDIQLNSLRLQIASVSQKVTLFAASVRDNIAYGSLASSSDAQIMVAAKTAFAHDFIMALPNQYDTVLANAGQSLSGGQRQRIAIARAMLKNAPILILDEATSALDNESEHYIQEALDNAMNKADDTRTTLVIAHRLSTVENADRIVVMDKGRIVEQGTHSELIGKNGLYAAMHARDFSDTQ